MQYHCHPKTEGAPGHFRCLLGLLLRIAILHFSFSILLCGWFVSHKLPQRLDAHHSTMQNTGRRYRPKKKPIWRCWQQEDMCGHGSS